MQHEIRSVHFQLSPLASSLQDLARIHNLTNLRPMYYRSTVLTALLAVLTFFLLLANWGTTLLFWKICLSRIEWKHAWQSGVHSVAHVQQHVTLHEHIRLWKESGLAHPWVSNPIFGARDGDVLGCWTRGAQANTAAAMEFTVSLTQNISKSTGLLLAW